MTRHQQDSDVQGLVQLPDDVKFPVDSGTEMDDLQTKLRNAATVKLIVGLCSFSMA